MVTPSPSSLHFYEEIVKYFSLMLLCLFMATIPLVAQSSPKSKKLDINPRILKDSSEDNQVLVVMSLEVKRDITGKKIGPTHITFCKTEPVVGPRFTPAIGLNGKNRDSNHIVFFDQLQSGETYKLYDYFFTDGNIITGFFDYRPVLGIMGEEATIKIDKPGIYYMGAFQPNFMWHRSKDPEKNKALKLDPSTTELTVYQALLENLKDYPGWTKLVETRIKELAQ